jgi:hypothetical protein
MGSVPLLGRVNQDFFTSSSEAIRKVAFCKRQKLMEILLKGREDYRRKTTWIIERLLMEKYKMDG